MGRAPPAAANPHPDGYRRLDLSLRERWARAESPGRSRAKIFALSKSGGSRTPGTGSQFLVDASVLASRAAVLDQGPPFLSAVGSPYRTWPVRAFGPYTGQTRRPSPDPLPAFRRPRRSTGRSVTIAMIELSSAAEPPIPDFISASSFDHLVGEREQRG